MKKYIALTLALFTFYASPSAFAGDDYMPTLMTETPFEGRQLAIKLARKSIGTMQSDKTVKHALRPVYSKDAGMLIEAAQVIAIEFQTIAAANNYWKD